MIQRIVLCLVLLSASGAAATSSFLLGLDYTSWGPDVSLNSPQIAVDGSGELYIMARCSATVTPASTSCVTKLSADGKTGLWQKDLGFMASAMAVDSNGGVYAAPNPGYSENMYLEKLSSDGATIVYKTNFGQFSSTQSPGPVGLAVDATGRVFVSGSAPLTNVAVAGEWIIRVNAAGVVDMTLSNVPGEPASIAVDPTGSHVAVTLVGYPAYSFARLAPDNATWVKFAPPLATILPALAVAPNGDAVVYGSDINGNQSLQRIDSTGAVVFSKALPSLGSATQYQPPAALALDAAGNMYIVANSGSSATQLKNSLAQCNGSLSAWLSVLAPDGSTMQTTYLPGSSAYGASFEFIAVAPNSAVFALTWAPSTFTPTLTGPFTQALYPTALFHLSPNANATVFPLACIGNAASYSAGSVVPGELVSLFGNGLGPLTGVQLSASQQTPFPTQAAGVQVTFDGKPAPLTWVQDSQVNVAVPWSVTGPKTQVCITYGSAPASCGTWNVGQTSAGVFTVDGVHAAAVNQDGTINSATNPAPLDSIVSVYATGLGPINPSLADGSLAPVPLPANTFAFNVQQPCYTTGCVPASFNVAYAGPAPFLIAGTSQINFSASDAMSNGAPAALCLVAASQSATAYCSGNSFQIYLAGKTGQ